MSGDKAALSELRRKMDEQAEQVAELHADLRRRLAGDGAPAISSRSAKRSLAAYYGSADPTGREQRAARRGRAAGGDDDGGDDE
ncbi:hypothetical protein [Candidatus Solirubrobacter pratensis]|uniref:hypothetical protein n=1 Tax=Candidatus Solirubrobacter pratensis TaxID=1298857 RepID=UPI0004175197|nr:hypothetical protein [Candidatus Solirubrobacter pratensis]